MKKIALAGLVLGVTAAAPSAFAQCPPGSWLCADITIGTAPPPVYVAPPPVYMVPPPPPRVVVVQPPPPRVIFAPAPPPVVVYQPMQVYQQPPQPQYQPPQYQPVPQRRSYLGLQAQLGGSFLSSARGGPNFIGGLGGGLRFRNASGHFGAELAVSVLGGQDFNGDNRVEIPITATAMYYFNPENRFQLYGLAGLGVSVADVQYAMANRAAHGGRSSGEYAHFGGYLGVGGELQLSRQFALFLDTRLFLRTRIDESGQSNPEFARTLASGTTQTTNSSVGLFTQFGAVFYF